MHGLIGGLRFADFYLSLWTRGSPKADMCNLYSITTNQAAIIALFRVINRYVGNLPPMTGVFPTPKAHNRRRDDGLHNLLLFPHGLRLSAHHSPAITCSVSLASRSGMSRFPCRQI